VKDDPDSSFPKRSIIKLEELWCGILDLYKITFTGVGRGAVWDRLIRRIFVIVGMGELGRAYLWPVSHRVAISRKKGISQVENEGQIWRIAQGVIKSKGLEEDAGSTAWLSWQGLNFACDVRPLNHCGKTLDGTA